MIDQDVELIRDSDDAIQPRDLRAEASSPEHLVTHKPKNPFCPVCSRAKTTKLRYMKGAFDRKLERWGQLITADRADSKSAKMLGLNGEKEALDIKDVMSGLKNIFPIGTKSADDAFKSLQRFC